MFEGMDQVDWAHLWAWGPRTEAPRLIHALASSTNRVERKAALSALGERVVLYQGGTILEVTPYVCPSCGLVLDRDENAAVNMLASGRAGPSGANVTQWGERRLRSLAL